MEVIFPQGGRFFHQFRGLLILSFACNNQALVSTESEGRKYGNSFVGVTPMINCPLSDCKISVLSCIVPGFDVLYKFFNSSVCGSDYSAFLRDITRFFRIYICSSNAQIALIEDNCRIHCTQEVEDIITNL